MEYGRINEPMGRIRSWLPECMGRDGVEEGGGSSDGGSGNETSLGFTPKIDELEILLEAYFVQIEGTLNKLSTVS